MKKYCMTALLAIFALGIFAQDFSVPKNYKLETPEDCSALEKDVLNAVNWLLNTPINKDAKKRKEVNSFVLEWAAKSSDISIELNTDIVTFTTSSPDLLMIYIGGWIKQSLETGDRDNKVAGTLAGMNASLDFYVKNEKLLQKDKEVEKYLKMREKGTLENYVKEKVK